MKKNPNFYLSHIVEAIKKINKYTKGLRKEEFLEKDIVQDAVVRNIEIIGEAVKNLPREFKEKHKDTPLEGYRRNARPNCAFLFWNRFAARMEYD
ncbi:MAG TPA: HepT-like ribonuclease domain-containing protein [Candidatus Bilamarchaeaceae archaeon]|nr:HepT-like ribonuclease domain-containing protein [Candidatus Bilamarchaeaceae archaeon]